MTHRALTVRPSHAAIAAGIIALILYLPAMRNGFAYDDVAVIQLDERIHSLANAPGFFTTGYWADSDLALYRPLTTLSFAVDWALSGGDAAWFHFMNAVWNALACGLAFFFLLRFGGIGTAFLGAVLFAAHPVHVEAVANVVGRAELVAASFMLGALLLWPTRAARAPGRIAGVAVLFALALLTKESAIMLPALLILADAATGDLRRQDVRGWLHSRVVPLLLLAGVAIGYMVVRVSVLGGVAPARLDAALEVTSGSDRFFTALHAWPHYARLLFVPQMLLADYGPRIIMPADGITPSAAAGFVMLASLVAGGFVVWWRGAGGAALALLWFPVAILPVSNLIVPIGIIVAERTLYLPSLAIAIALVMAARHARPSIVTRRIAVVGMAVIIALFAARTIARIPDWQSTDSIFAALLRDRPDSFRAHWHRARTDAAEGRRTEAIQGYARALELWPHRHRLVIEAVRTAGRVGYHEYARELARYAATRWPRDPDAVRLHAAAALDSGDTIAARRIIADGLVMIPGDSLLLRMQHAISDRMDQ